MMTTGFCLTCRKIKLVRVKPLDAANKRFEGTCNDCLTRAEQKPLTSNS